MRSGCPQWVQAKIPNELSIEFWCRRAVYEFIEELSDAIWWTIVIASFANLIYMVLGRALVVLGIAAVLIIAWPFRHFFFEFWRWRNEIHVVARNDEKGGGMYFRFSGGRSGSDRNTKKDPITDRSPAADVKQSWFYRLWGFVTGEQMIRLTLKSDNNIFLEGRKVSPQLDSAVDRTRLATPRGDEIDMPDKIQWVRELTRLEAAGLRDRERTQFDIDTIIGQVLYGNYS